MIPCMLSCKCSHGCIRKLALSCELLEITRLIALNESSGLDEADNNVIHKAYDESVTRCSFTSWYTHAWLSFKMIWHLPPGHLHVRPTFILVASPCGEHDALQNAHMHLSSIQQMSLLASKQQSDPAKLKLLQCRPFAIWMGETGMGVACLWSVHAMSNEASSHCSGCQLLPAMTGVADRCQTGSVGKAWTDPQLAPSADLDSSLRYPTD